MSEERRPYRGKWANLSAVTIAGLMGCSVPTARFYLTALAERLGGSWQILPEHIGQIVARYRELNEYELVSRGTKFTGRQRLALIVPGVIGEYYQSGSSTRAN